MSAAVRFGFAAVLLSSRSREAVAGVGEGVKTLRFVGGRGRVGRARVGTRARESRDRDQSGIDGVKFGTVPFFAITHEPA
jgi:hypothetical protein